MDDARRRRYRGKLAHLEERRQDVASWTAGADPDKKTRLAVYKALQEVIEAAMDICAMWVADLGISPQDDYVNVTALRDRGFLGAETVQVLSEANGLRNRLVHTYNGIDDRRVLEFVSAHLVSFSGFVSAVERWMA